MPSSGVQEPSFAHGSLPEKSVILIYFPGTGEELEGLALSLLGPASLSTVKGSDTTKVLETEGAYLLSGTRNPVRTLLRLLLCPPNAYCLLGCKVPCLGPNILTSGLVQEGASLAGHILQPGRVSRAGQAVCSKVECPRWSAQRTNLPLKRSQCFALGNVPEIFETSFSEFKKGKTSHWVFIPNRRPSLE